MFEAKILETLKNGTSRISITNTQTMQSFEFTTSISRPKEAQRILEDTEMQAFLFNARLVETR